MPRLSESPNGPNCDVCSAEAQRLGEIAALLARAAALAAERDRAADQRDELAHAREELADRRERAADLRERFSDEAWYIVHMSETEPVSDRDTVKAVRVYLTHVDEEHQIVVELSRVGSERGWDLDAYRAAEAYLDYERPPELLIVQSDGTAYPSG